MTGGQDGPMIGRLGWQIILADLALILFMISAGALHAHRGRAAEIPQRAEAIAIYRPQPGAPGMGEWLAGQQPDPRLRLTVVATYADGNRRAAGEAAERLAAQAGRLPVRVILEPGERADVFATLGFDGWHGDCWEGASPARKDARSCA